MKRIAAAFLWFVAGWYLGGYVALLTHVSPLISPLMGLAAALLIGADPRRIIWTDTNRQNHA